MSLLQICLSQTPLKMSTSSFYYSCLAPCILGNFSLLFLLSADFFFKINFLSKSFRNTIRVSNGPDLGPNGPDLGPNGSQKSPGCQGKS